MPMVEIKVFNVLIDNKLFFDQSATSKQETYEKRIDVLRNDDNTTWSLLDFSYHQNYLNSLV